MPPGVRRAHQRVPIRGLTHRHHHRIGQATERPAPTDEFPTSEKGRNQHDQLAGRVLDTLRVTGFVGPNGSGKSTTMMVGLTDSGRDSSRHLGKATS